MRGLEDMAGKLDAAAVAGELWVDGSFVTEKINPNDADVVLKLESTVVENADPAQEAIIGWVNSNTRATHLCDSYVFVTWPVGHPQYWVGEYMESYWMRQWGFDRANGMKGMAVIALPL